MVMQHIRLAVQRDEAQSSRGEAMHDGFSLPRKAEAATPAWRGFRLTAFPETSGGFIRSVWNYSTLTLWSRTGNFAEPAILMNWPWCRTPEVRTIRKAVAGQ